MLYDDPERRLADLERPVGLARPEVAIFPYAAVASRSLLCGKETIYDTLALSQ